MWVVLATVRRGPGQGRGSLSECLCSRRGYKVKDQYDGGSIPYLDSIQRDWKSNSLIVIGNDILDRSEVFSATALASDAG